MEKGALSTETYPGTPVSCNFSTVFRLIACVGIIFLVSLTIVYFHPLLALWIVALVVLTLLRPTYALLLLFIAISIDIERPTYGGLIVSFSELEFGACFLAWFGKQELSRLRLQPLLWGVPFLFAVTVSGIYRIEWYKIPPHTLRASEIFLMLFLVLEVFRPRDRRVIQVGLVLAGLLYSTSGLLQFTPWSAAKLTSGARAFSFFTNPNQFAAYLNLLLPFYFVFILTSAGRRIRLLWIYLFAWTLIAQLSTLSRSVALALLISVLTMTLIHYRPGLSNFLRDPVSPVWRWLKHSVPVVMAHLAAVLLVGLLLLSSTSINDSIQNSLENLKLRSARGLVGSLFDSRIPYWDVGFQIWKDQPWVGVGPGRYTQVAGEYRAVVDTYQGRVSYFAPLEAKYRIHTHDLFLQCAATYGLLGLVGLLFFMVQILRRVLLQMNTSGGFVTIGLLFAFLAQNLVDVTFPSLAMETGFVLGLALGYDGLVVSSHPHCVPK